MTLQFIHDNNGNTTGVFIPIDDWQLLKTKYVDLQKEEVENVLDLTDWQKKIIDERLNYYLNNKLNVVNFDKTLDDIEKSL
ncbi:MAG: hypothetical protein ACEQSR_07680 [Candidatus Methylacidiphilales bacterium]